MIHKYKYIDMHAYTYVCICNIHKHTNIPLYKCVGNTSESSESLTVIYSIRAWARGAKATQQGLLGTIRGYWALLGLIGKTWLPFPRL